MKQKSNSLKKLGSSLKTKYICKHCKKIVLRKSDKQWIKSLCDKTGKIVHLMREK